MGCNNHVYKNVFLLFRFQFTIGRLPFEGENIYKLFGAISTGEFTIPTDVPYALQDLIKGISFSNLK